jgi:hypothetical protein
MVEILVGFTTVRSRQRLVFGIESPNQLRDIKAFALSAPRYACGHPGGELAFDL